MKSLRQNQNNQKIKINTSIASCQKRIGTIKLILLHLPETKNGYKYLLVVTDVATSNMDFEPMKTTNSAEAVEAFKAIAKRKYLNLPTVSVKTDGGPEFKANFNKFLIDNKIAHITAVPNRHSQMAVVERLNKT